MTRDYVRVGLAAYALLVLGCNTFDSPSQGDGAFTPPSFDGFPSGAAQPPPSFGFPSRAGSPAIAGSGGAPVLGGLAGTVGAAGSGGPNGGWQFFDAGTVDAGVADDAGSDDAGR